MNWTLIKQPSAFLPVAMSLAALAVVLGYLAVNGVVREPDEGAAAHIWQLLMAGQLPIIAFFAKLLAVAVSVPFPCPSAASASHAVAVAVCAGFFGNLRFRFHGYTSPLPTDLVPVSLVRPTLLAIAAATLSMGSTRSRGSVAQDGVSITFLANEGVLLSSGGKHVLIDALFLKYETGFAVPPDSTRAALQRARSPFDAVDLVLVTHRHGDHFHPAPVVAHLLANPRATLLTSRQVIDSLRGRLPANGLLAPRLRPRTTAPGERRHEVVSGINVELLGLPHGGRQHRRVEHLGYIVELGGRRVLHVGDADFTEATFAPFRLDTARIDVALLPHWMVTSRGGRRVIERWIRPRQVVAFHVTEDEVERVPRAVQSAVPGAITFIRPLERRSW